MSHILFTYFYSSLQYKIFQHKKYDKHCIKHSLSLLWTDATILSCCFRVLKGKHLDYSLVKSLTNNVK